MIFMAHEEKEISSSTNIVDLNISTPLQSVWLLWDMGFGVISVEYHGSFSL